jgi:CubicO group peptidase (beta-lactamase class C family)
MVSSRLEADAPGSSARRDFLKFAGLASLSPGLLAACGGSDDSPPTYQQTIADARLAIREALAATNTPAISVALIERDRLVWAETFGFIDRAEGRAPTTETLFCMGSCSKVIAATAVMILVDRGLVDLDAPLTTYLPDFRMASPEYTRVTVRMLLDHSSGFPGADYRGIFREDPGLDYAAQVKGRLPPPA